MNRLFETWEASLTRYLTPTMGEEAARVAARSRMWLGVVVVSVVLWVGGGIALQSGGGPLAAGALAVGLGLCGVSWGRAILLGRRADRLSREYHARHAGASGDMPHGTSMNRALPPSQSDELRSLIGERAERYARLGRGLRLLAALYVFGAIVAGIVVVLIAPPAAATAGVIGLASVVGGAFLGGLWLEQRAEHAADAHVSAKLGYPVHLGRGHRTKEDWEAAVEQARQEHDRTRPG